MRSQQDLKSTHEYRACTWLSKSLPTVITHVSRNQPCLYFQPLFTIFYSINPIIHKGVSAPHCGLGTSFLLFIIDH